MVDFIKKYLYFISAAALGLETALAGIPFYSIHFWIIVACSFGMVLGWDLRRNQKQVFRPIYILNYFRYN